MREMMSDARVLQVGVDGGPGRHAVAGHRDEPRDRSETAAPADAGPAARGASAFACNASVEQSGSSMAA
eukprot:2405099-Pleurochrysis_carterae.AAC.3